MLRKLRFPLVGCLLFLAGCGGGGGQVGGTPVSGYLISGTVAMPNNMAIPAGATVVDGNFIGSPDAQGNFRGRMQSAGIHTLSLNSSTGEVLLLGATAPDGSAAVDVKHTAAVLLYYGLGLWVTPPASQDALFTDLLNQPATATFASVIATRLSADPFCSRRSAVTL